MAVKLIVVPAQIVVAEAPIITDGVKTGLTVITIGLEVAVVGEAQLTDEVITQVTTSPCASVELL